MLKKTLYSLLALILLAAALFAGLLFALKTPTANACAWSAAAASAV